MYKKQLHSKTRQQRITLIALLAFIVQAVVPIGYMPASFADDGSLIKFCPGGVSDDVMAILHAGHDMENHHSHHPGGHHSDTHVAGEHAGHPTLNAHPDWQNDCVYGSASTGYHDILLSDTNVPNTEKTTLIHQTLITQHYAAKQLRKQRQRAPPSLDSLHHSTP